jgi:hypothetical protein
MYHLLDLQTFFERYDIEKDLIRIKGEGEIKEEELCTDLLRKRKKEEYKIEHLKKGGFFLSFQQKGYLTPHFLHSFRSTYKRPHKFSNKQEEV